MEVAMRPVVLGLVLVVIAWSWGCQVDAPIDADFRADVDIDVNADRDAGTDEDEPGKQQVQDPARPAPEPEPEADAGTTADASVDEPGCTWADECSPPEGTTAACEDRACVFPCGQWVRVEASQGDYREWVTVEPWAASCEDQGGSCTQRGTGPELDCVIVGG